MRFLYVLISALVCLSPLYVSAQSISAAEGESGSIAGYVVDSEDAEIPGAKVEVDGAAAADHRETKADEVGHFVIEGLKAGVAYRVTIKEEGFASYRSDEVRVAAGEELNLASLKLAVAEVDASVDAISPEQMAIEQVNAESKQRILGLFPNFYVVYDGVVAPLSAKLKFKLAYKAMIDPENLFGAAVVGATNQAGNTPDYHQGWAGYGQRVGALFADGTTDVLFGGAILPVLLHQDPRYYYQGEGSKKSRTLHALASPFVCKGDNGKNEFNFSSIGGDLISGAISETYYPASNRGFGLVFANAAVTSGGRMVNALLQEFVLRKLSTFGKKTDK